MLQHAQRLVYSLVFLMPGVYQKASLKAILGLFLEFSGRYERTGYALTAEDQFGKSFYIAIRLFSGL